MRQKRARELSAFTIVELVVATAITVSIAAIIIGTVTSIMGTWTQSTGKLRNNNDTKIALESLTQDLHATVMKADANVWFAATIQPDQVSTGDCGSPMAVWSATSGGITKPGNASPGTADSSLDLQPTSTLLADYRFGMGGAWLRFFTVDRDTNDADDSRSTVRAVAYQIVRYRVGGSTGSSIRYGLFRSSVRPYDSTLPGQAKSVFTLGYNLFMSGSGPNYNNPAFSGDLDSDPGTPDNDNGGPSDPGSIRRPDRSTILANNVVDFGVRIWTRTTSGSLQLIFPATSGGVPTNANLGFAATTSTSAVPPSPASGAPTVTDMTYGYPAAVEIFMRVLTDQGATKLEALERGQITGTAWWEFVLANSDVHTRWVDLKGREL